MTGYESVVHLHLRRSMRPEDPTLRSISLRSRRVSLAASCLAIAVSGLASTVAAQTGSPSPLVTSTDGGVFEPTGSMAIGRELPTATLLADGRVLVAGGYGGVTDGPGGYPEGTEALASAEVWDPESEVFEPAGTLMGPRSGHTATLLLDGRVLIVGGSGPDGYLSSAEIWDPATLTSSATGSLDAARFGARAMLLADGRVLVLGGETEDGQVAPPEVWDAATGTFGPGDAIPEAGYPEGTVLDDGRVLVFTEDPRVPGDASSVDGPRTAMVWDPATGSSTPAGKLNVAHGDRFTATDLTDGRVLIAGGDGCPHRGPCSAVAAAEIWDPASMAFGMTDALGRPRYGHTATLLRDGRVLVVADGLSGRPDTAEVFEPR